MTARGRARLGAVAAGALAVGVLAAAPQEARAQAGTELRPPAAFAGIRDRVQRSSAVFVEAGKVFQHPRCRNCHPPGDHPLQGDEGRPHQPMVRRGADGLGVPGLRSSTCHPEANYDAVGMPGQHGWHLAPLSMALGGRSLPEICAQLRDVQQNGGRTLAEVVQHLATDPLVIWAWTPRTRPAARPRDACDLRRAHEGLGRHGRGVPAPLIGATPHADLLG